MKNAKDQVYALIAQRPKIRTVEIADIIDCDVEHVQPGLAHEIARGDIIVHELIAPNGRPANGFEFSDAFKRTAAYRDIVGAAGISAEQASPPAPQLIPARSLGAPQAAKNTAECSAAAPAPTPAPAPAPQPAPTLESPATATGSYPERAVAYIGRCGGRANNEALRIAIGLGPGAAPSSYLHTAVSSGRLARDGRDWVLGPNAAAPTRYTPGKTKPRAIPAAKPAAAPAAVEASPDLPPPAAFRVGRWSDGVLEIQRAGQTIAVLSAAEQADVKSFLEIRT